MACTHKTLTIIWDVWFTRVAKKRMERALYSIRVLPSNNVCCLDVTMSAVVIH